MSTLSPTWRLRYAGIDIAVIAVMAILTLLVWGLYPFERGIRFGGDDLNFLFSAWQNLGAPLGQQLTAKYPPDGWTRALAFWPFVVASHVRLPVVFLQVFYAVVWLLNGLAIANLARVLWPQSALAPMIAGCLMVTATSDTMTDVIVYGPHLLGIALFFFGTAQLMRSVEPSGKLRHALAAALLLMLSYFTVEYTYAAVPLLPVLALVHAGSWRDRRFLRALGVVMLSFIPPAAVLARALLGASYASQVLAVKMPFSDWLALFGSHVWHNFWPVGWAFRRIPPWFDNYEPAFPPIVFIAVTGLGALLALWRFRSAIADWGPNRSNPPARVAMLVGVSLAAITCVNAVSANSGGEFFVRSHLVSRGWASLALALVLTRLACVPSLRVAVGLLFGLVIFLGVWGGVERQSYLLGYGQSERRELASLQDAVPGFDPSAKIVVIQPPGSPTVMAMNNPNSYPFLYGSNALRAQFVMAPNWASEYSSIDGGGDGKIHILVNSQRSAILDPATCIMVFYSVSQGRFVLFREIPAGLLRASADISSGYRPLRWLRPGFGHNRPRALTDFFAHDAGITFRAAGARSNQSAGLLSIEPSLRDKVSADVITPHMLEPEPVKGSFAAWLGTGRANGYSSLVWVREPTAAILSLRMELPGTQPKSDQRLAVRVTQANGRQDLATRLLGAGASDHDLALNLAPGHNVLEIWLEDGADRTAAPDSGKRGRLKQMLLRPARTGAPTPAIH